MYQRKPHYGGNFDTKKLVWDANSPAPSKCGSLSVKDAYFIVCIKSKNLGYIKPNTAVGNPAYRWKIAYTSNLHSARECRTSSYGSCVELNHSLWRNIENVWTQER
jgi:hypothetical protein